MLNKTIQLPKPHQAQQQIINEATRFNVVDCGRRFGKTLFGEDRLIHPALAGEPVGWFAPTYKYLGEAWRDILHILQPIVERRDKTERRIELITGGVLEFWTLDNPNAGRGRKYKRIVIDEAAMIPHLQEAWTAALLPTLGDLQGDAYFLSTPKGRNGFWQMYQWGLDSERPDWTSWQFQTGKNPYISKTEIEIWRSEMPERIYAQEVLAQFLEDAGGVFRRVMDAAVLSPQEPQEDHEYIMGVDWAKSVDFTVLAVVDIGMHELVSLDRFNQIDYRVQRGRVKALYERYKPTVILAEANSIGEPNIEDLRAEGLPVQGFTTTNATKKHIIEALALAFERGDIRILNDPTLVGELQAYEMTRSPSGLYRYGAPEGMHDDMVMALALAWHAATMPKPVLAAHENPFYG